MVTIIDYGMGNLFSASKACQYLGHEALVTDNPEAIAAADRLILPGVGAFGQAMGYIRSKGLESAITTAVKNGIPILGICLGMQLMFKNSEEDTGIDGLSLINGNITRFPPTTANGRLKVPHMGWNSLFPREGSRLFKGIDKGSQVYFVHSYCAADPQSGYSASVTEYGIPFTSAVEQDNVFATQFHPEKSGKVGLHILDNFLNINGDDL